MCLFSISQVGKVRSGTNAWPPYREPGACHQAYGDPRKILKCRIFHSVVWIILYKALTQHNVSEHVMSLVVYLLEMALAVTDSNDQPTQVCIVNFCDIIPNEIEGRAPAVFFFYGSHSLLTPKLRRFTFSPRNVDYLNVKNLWSVQD